MPFSDEQDSGQDTTGERDYMEEIINTNSSNNKN